METKDGLPLIAPEIDIPEGFERYWSIFWDVSNSVSRSIDGVVMLVPPSEWYYWSKLTNTVLNPDEFALLRAMDAAFCSQLNAEIAEKREKDKGQKP